jgi:lactoylglutathione lyase
MAQFTSLGHAAIRVKDVERSLDVYVRQLGFAEMMRLNHEDGRLMLIYLRITDDQYLEVFPDAEGDRAPGINAVGYNHICLIVDDMDGILAKLAEQSVPLFRPKKVGLDRNVQAWIEDPDGNRIELMQMAPNSMQSEAIQRLRQGL